MTTTGGYSARRRTRLRRTITVVTTVIVAIAVFVAVRARNDTPSAPRRVTAATSSHVSSSTSPRTPQPSVPSTPTSTATGLDPALASAFSDAAAAAKAEGVTVAINSGFRTWAKQQRMWQAAIKKYGSARVAKRWVLPPAYSAHVQGRALDIKPRSGAKWLQRNGATFGLCRMYDNEWWHFELATSPGGTCPKRLPNAARLVP